MYNALVNAAAFIILILLIGRIFDVVMDLLLGILTNLFGPTIAFLFSNVITFVAVISVVTMSSRIRPIRI